MSSPLSATDSYIQLRGVAKEFPDNTGLHSTDLDIDKGEFISILGPSGCGKSTLLRCIAGLEQPDKGTINLAGKQVYAPNVHVPVNKRNLSMVFQDLALWPHMSVAKNIEFPLTTRVRKMPKAERTKAVERCMDMVGIRAKAQAHPAQLSGGQQQRVAIARALVSSPDIVLMDEPLSALDAALREQIRSELRTLAKELDLTVIYVTHDQEEALAMSDRIVVMNQGSVEQYADPVSIYEQPASDFVATFVGVMNTHPDVGHIRPEHMCVYPDRNAVPADDALTVCQGRITDVRYVGGRYELRCQVEDFPHSWLVYSVRRYDVGDDVAVAINLQSMQGE